MIPAGNLLFFKVLLRLDVLLPYLIKPHLKSIYILFFDRNTGNIGALTQYSQFGLLENPGFLSCWVSCDLLFSNGLTGLLSQTQMKHLADYNFCSSLRLIVFQHETKCVKRILLSSRPLEYLPFWSPAEAGKASH